MINSGKIKGRIIELGLNQAEVAKMIGIAQATLSQKINNIRPMDLDEADKLATVLSIPPDEYNAYFFYTPVA